MANASLFLSVAFEISSPLTPLHILSCVSRFAMKETTKKQTTKNNENEKSVTGARPSVPSVASSYAELKASLPFAPVCRMALSSLCYYSLFLCLIPDWSFQYLNRCMSKALFNLSQQQQQLTWNKSLINSRNCAEDFICIISFSCSHVQRTERNNIWKCNDLSVVSQLLRNLSRLTQIVVKPDSNS